MTSSAISQFIYLVLEEQVKHPSEMGDVEEQSKVQSTINSQVKEMNQDKEKGDQE